MTHDWPDAIKRARRHAPYLATIMDTMPDLTAFLEQGDAEAAFAYTKALRNQAQDLGVALRREKQALALTLAIGDLAGAFPLSHVTEALSDFADYALHRAIRAAISRRVPDTEPSGFIALALGKHGARELNYSSDIDPILIYDPETLPRRARDEPGEAAQRYARDIVQMLSQNTGHGYVFRVDLRLRPASEVSPLAISLSAATTHYESSALTWERAAFIRARACAGDIVLGEEFLASIRSFIWRKSLDFGAIDEIRGLTLRVRANYSGPQVPGPGFNLKQGRGGIREVEFYAQTHQLIHGGRDPSLRVRGTRAALDALADAGWISAPQATLLGESYDALRVIEHRLQMVADQQTHSLPEGEGLDNVARLNGMANGEALTERVAMIADGVGTLYDSLVEEDESAPKQAAPLSANAEPVAKRLAALGFADPQMLAERIEGWGDGRMRAMRSDAAQRAFEACLPALLEAFAEAPDPKATLLRWERVLGGLPSAINLFRLLEARPALLGQLVDVLTLAPPLAEALGRRPHLLDALIDHSALDLPGSVDELAASMRRSEAERGYEGVLDRIRIVTGETRFALGVQLIENAHDPLDIGAALARTAEAAMRLAVEASAAEFAERHGTIAGAELVVLGLGRLGGGVLTHDSDLDIVYLFTGDHGAESDGKRPLGATLYFNRLAQRVSAALSVPTAEGALYEIDTRLRPQGSQGPLAVSVDSFARYQKESAWGWEHMALTRARPISGSAEAQASVRTIISDVLKMERGADDLREHVRNMRDEMATHKHPRGPLDVKLARGGLVDLEFLIHYKQLAHRTAFDPDLAAALVELSKADLLPDTMLPAYRLLTRQLIGVRLLAPDLFAPPGPAAQALARNCGFDTLDAMRDETLSTRSAIAEIWREVFDQELEIIP